MRISTHDLAQAREITAQLLDDLPLPGYLFEIEPGDGEWALRLDCPVEGDWTSLTIPVDGRRLLAAQDDPELREEILRNWRQRISGEGPH